MIIRVLGLSMAPKQLFLDSLWNASDSLWHIAFFDRTKISQMVVSRYGNCLNMLLVLISLQLQMISDGSWLQKVVIWMQTFSAGKKITIGLSIPHKRNNRTDVWRELQSNIALVFGLAVAWHTKCDLLGHSYARVCLVFTVLACISKSSKTILLDSFCKTSYI